MLGFNTKAVTNTNELIINIPDELKGIELQVIVLPLLHAEDTNFKIDFFTLGELKMLSNVDTTHHELEEKKD